MRVSILLSYLFITLIACGQPTITDIVNSLAEVNSLHHEKVGIAGNTSNQYLNFVKLKETATIQELLHLTEHKNGVVKCYAAWALADSNYPAIEKVFQKFLNKDKEISSFSFCIMSNSNITNELYFRIQGAKYASPSVGKGIVYIFYKKQELLIA